jgi:hypothetical protein
MVHVKQGRADLWPSRNRGFVLPANSERVGLVA